MKSKINQRKEIETQRKTVWQNQKEVDDFNTMVGDFHLLHNLRNNYLHCSANMDGVGMEPTRDINNNIKWKRKIIPG